MKKNFKYYLIAWMLLLALYNVIIFVTPSNIAEMPKFDGTFWVSYAFVMLSFVGQLVCSYIALNSDKAKKLFLRFPLVTISYSALIVSIIVGTLCMAIPFIPTWVAIIVCVSVLVFYCIAILKAYAASQIVDSTEHNVKAQTLFVKCLTVDMDSLVSRAQSQSIKTDLKRLYDVVRYSDPMSNVALSGVESQIIIQFNALAEAVSANDDALSKAIADEMIILLNDRNKKCKLMK